MTDTWVIVGASRGIGLEFVRQLLQNGHHVIAGVRNESKADQLFELKSHCTKPERCIIAECDITNEESIQVCLFRLKLTIKILIMTEICQQGWRSYPERAKGQEYCTQCRHTPVS